MKIEVGKFYRNKLHNDQYGQHQPIYNQPIYKCKFVGQTINVFSYELKHQNDKIDEVEFVLDNKQIIHWEEYREPITAERAIVWWNHKSDKKRMQPYCSVLTLDNLFVYEKNFNVHKVEMTKITIE